MSSLTAYKCTPRQIRKHTVRCIQAGLVPYIQSSPAMGKSSIVKSIADEYGLELIDHRLSTSAPEDLSGLPKFTTQDTATFVPFDMFPVAGRPLPKGKQGWLLFLDEMNAANKSVQAAAYKLILDRMVGQQHLHPNVAIVCAGNLATDRAIVNPLSTAMQSRVIHLLMELKFEDFIADVAHPYGWDWRIIAYLSYRQAHLHDFRPDHNDLTFCSPRTWDFLNKLIKGHEVVEEDAALYAGTITTGVALDFIQFTKVHDKLPKLADIIRSPDTTPLPEDTPTKFSTTSYLIEHVDNDTFEPVATYINRLSAEFRILFYRGLMIRQPKLREHPVFRKSLLELSKYLHD
jgi:hypothetical protein